MGPVIKKSIDGEGITSRKATPQKVATNHETMSRRITSKAYYSWHSILTLYRNAGHRRMCLKSL